MTYRRHRTTGRRRKPGNSSAAEPRISAINSGRASISSRWISISLRRPEPPSTAACTALTSELLPMPRAPHSSALLAGRPAAKRSGVLEQDVANLIDSLQEIEIDPVDLRDLAQAIAGGMPDKGGMGTEVRHRRRRAGQAFQSRGNPFQPLENPLIRLACHMVHLKGRAVARVHTAGTGRGQASRAGCKWGNRRYIPPPEAPRLGRAGRLMAPPKAMPLFRRFL